MAARKSWLSIPSGSHFSLANIPFGIISTTARPLPHPAIAIGEFALDLTSFAAHRGFDGLPSFAPHLHVFSQPTLNAFAALGRPVHRQVRRYIQDVLASDTTFPHVLQDNEALRGEALIPLIQVQYHLPMKVETFTDFYTGVNHARTAGIIMRGPANELQPNFFHLPVGYHSRGSSVVVSGTPIRRPRGQINPDPTIKPAKPIFSPTRRMDIELELGAFICRENKIGDPIPIGEAEEGIFGVVLLNDWSARDIQTWEYVPLGPFNAKSFGTSISPWIVLPDALEPFLTESLYRDRELMPYLQEKRQKNVPDVALRVDVTPQNGKTTTMCRNSSKNTVFSFAQMLAHHTITGCNMQVGDLIATGTISGTEQGTEGCFFERTRNGKLVIPLEGGGERIWLEDGDTITITGVAGSDPDALVGFGSVVGQILPAHE